MRTFTLISILLWSLIGWTQGFTVKVSKSTVATGERFQLTYTAHGNASHFEPPKFDHFQLLSGPNTSSEMRWVNGKFSGNQSFSFILRAIEVGKFEISPASVKLDGKRVKSDPITVQVVKGHSSNTKSKKGGNQQKVNTQTAASDDLSSNLFMKLFVDKKNTVVGEQVIATYKLYINAHVLDLAAGKPVFNGFFTQEIDIDPNVGIKSEHINGKTFRVATIKKFVLTPQQTGELEVPQLDVRLAVRVQEQKRGRSIFDQMFGSYRNIKVDLKSNAETITVSPLPAQGQPGDFNGAVGTFTVSATTDRTEVNVNEAVNLTITIQGKGNIELVGEPDIDFPGDFETYEPKTRQNIAVNGSGSSGAKTFEYVLIPRYAGDFELEPYSFSYYEPVSKTYKRTTSGPIELNVVKPEGADDFAADDARMVAPKKEEVQIVGNDIRFIKTETADLHKPSDSFLGSPGFIGVSTLPVAGMVIGIFLIAWRRKREDDEESMKSRKAKGQAKKRLAAAQKLLTGDDTAFYEEIFRALYGYLSDKFNIPVSELNREAIEHVLEERSVNEDLRNDLRKALDECEMARFAPGAVRGKEDMLNLSSTLIEQIENEV